MNFRFSASLFLPLLLAVGPCDSELKQESAAMHMTGLVQEGTNTKPAVPQPNEPAEPAALPLSDNCATILAEIAQHAGPCAIEQQLAGGASKCTATTCPECKAMNDAQDQSEKLGC